MSYFESRLPADFNNINEIFKKLEFCEKLGIKNIILEPKKKLLTIPSELKNKLKEKTNLNIYYRINLKLENVEDFKNKINHFNNFSDILSIESLNKEVQLQAASDSRVDLVSFSNPEIIKTLTPGVISLTKQNKSFLEFSLAPIMISNKAIQSKNFRNLYKSIQLAFKFKASCIISGNFEDNYNLRHPRALISICHSLLGISLDRAKKIFRLDPILLLERTQKHSINTLKPEIRLIKGEDS